MLKDFEMILELTLDIANAFDEIAKTEDGERALDRASDCIDNWSELAAAELNRRMVESIFTKLSDDDLTTIMLNDGGEYQIDLNRLAWEAVKKARNI